VVSTGPRAHSRPSFSQLPKADFRCLFFLSFFIEPQEIQSSRSPPSAVFSEALLSPPCSGAPLGVSPALQFPQPNQPGKSADPLVRPSPLNARFAPFSSPLRLFPPFPTTDERPAAFSLLRTRTDEICLPLRLPFDCYHEPRRIFFFLPTRSHPGLAIFLPLPCRGARRRLLLPPRKEFSPLSPKRACVPPPPPLTAMRTPAPPRPAKDPRHALFDPPVRERPRDSSDYQDASLGSGMSF